MLVQLSPWETSRTSIRAQHPTLSNSSINGKRRRGSKGRSVAAENGEEQEQGESSSSPSVAVSFIAAVSKRALARMKAQSSELDGYIPHLTVTTDHRISVMGRRIISSDPSGNGNVDDDPMSSSTPNRLSSSSPLPPPYREFSALRYNSRPGDATSFFPTASKTTPLRKKNGSIGASGGSNSDLPRIPAMVDAKHNLVVALQHNNQRLCCWDMWESSGPDGKDSMKVDLDSPALSLSLLAATTTTSNSNNNKGTIMYGTCQNGNVFVARIVVASGTTTKTSSYGNKKSSLLHSKSSSNQLEVCYLTSPRPSHGSIHIGTCAEIRQSTNAVVKAGRKRKMSDAAAGETGTPMTFYQVYHDSQKVQIVRLDTSMALSSTITIAAASSTSTSAEGGLHNIETVRKVATLLDLGLTSAESLIGQDERVLANAEIFISTKTNTSPAMVLAYTIDQGRPSLITETHHDVTTFCATVSLAEAALASHPIKLDPGMKPFGLMSDTLVACASISSVSLFDLTSGALAASKKGLRGEQPRILQSDSKTTTIAVLSSPPQDESHDDGSLSLSTTRVSGGVTQSVLSNLKASAILTGSLLAAERNLKSHDWKHVASMIASMNGQTMEDAVEKALSALRVCTEQHQGGKAPSNSFGKVFDECLLDLTKDSDGRKADLNEGDSSMNEEMTPHNPQDPSNSVFESTRTTTRRSSKRNSTPLKNGRCELMQIGNAELLPQAFLDGTIRIILDAIRSPTLDGGNLVADTHLVLRRLLRTGRVSARMHFEGSFPLQETVKKHPLYVVLRLMHQQPLGRNPLTAMQLIVELLQSCTDLSERQLVIMVDYMLRFPHADDIAQTFADSTAIEMTQKLQNDSRSYISIRGEKPKESPGANMTEEAWDTIGRRLVLAGTELVFHMILCYSECNGIMLRIALAESLNSSVEAIVMAQLLTRMLKSSPSNTPLMHRKNPNFVRTICQWISSLCESFEEELKDAKSPTGTDYLTYLLHGVQAATRNSQAIISFKDGIGIAEAVKKERLERSTNAETSLWQAEEDLPGYSIDRFVF